MTALPTRLLTCSGSLPYGTPGEQPLEQALRIPTGTKLIVELVTSTFYRDPDQAADPPGRFVIDHAVPAVADATGTWTWAITPSSYLTDNQRWRIVLPGDPQSPRFFTMPDEDSDLFNLLDPAVAPPVVPSSSIRLHVGPTAPANPSEGDLWLDTALDPPVLQVFDGGRWRITGSQGRTVFARTAPTTGIDGDWWIDISTDPWTAYVRSTGAWHQVGSTGGGGSTAGLQTQITALRNEVALLEGFEDAFVIQTPLGSETVTVAASKAQDQTNIDLPTAGVAAKLHVAATIDGQAYEHAFDVASLRALPDAGTDPLSDAADNPPSAPNALRFQWDPNDSDQSLFVGHRSGKLVLSTAEAGQTTWALTDVRIRVVLNFSDLGDTPPGNVPGTRNVQTDASGNLTYGELISGITQLDGFPSVITDGRPFIGGPGNTVIQGDVPSSGGGGGGGAAKFTDHTDTPSAIPPGRQVLASTQAGGALEFVDDVVTTTPQRLSALPDNPQTGQWFVASQDFGSQLGATVTVPYASTQHGVQELVAAPAQVVDTITTPLTVEVGYADGEAVPFKLSAADIARIRALPDTPVNTGPPQNTPITTFAPNQKLDFQVRTFDGVILATMFIGHRGSRLWFAFQEDLGGAATVKFYTGLNATAGRTYIYTDGKWEDLIHWIGALRTDAEKAAITASVIPSALQVNSADRFPTGKLIRSMTQAEFTAETDQTGLIAIPVTSG